jgi:hypothetical protein
MDYENHTFSANSGNLINIAGRFGEFSPNGSVSFVGNVSVVPEPSSFAAISVGLAA